MPLDDQGGRQPTAVIVDLRAKPRKRMKQAQKARARELLMWAQGGLCAHCDEVFPATWELGGPDSPTIEHVEPTCSGGSNRIENLLLKHKACNEACGQRPPSPKDRRWQRVVAERLAGRSPC